MPNVLYVAWKVDPATSFVSSINPNENNFFYGFSSQLKDKKLTFVFPLAGRLVGGLYFFINRFLQLVRSPSADPLVTYIQRNYLNEWLLKFIIRRFKIDRVEFHWVGYGFFPSKSILKQDLKVQLIVTHHDWYHFTDGAHVPVSFTKLVNKVWLDCKKQDMDLSHRFVSMYQREILQRSVIHPYSVLENAVRTEFVELAAFGRAAQLYAQRVRYTDRKVVLFVGVVETVGDFKGVEVTDQILQALHNNNVISVGVACSANLSFDVAFSKLTAAELSVLMCIVDLVIVPSLLETYSMVSREAQEVGTPVTFRGNLAPVTFKDQKFLYPAVDESDEALLDKALEVVSVKSSSFDFANAINDDMTAKSKVVHCFCYVIYGQEDKYRSPVFKSAQKLAISSDCRIFLMTPACDFEDINNYFISLNNVEVIQIPTDFNQSIPRLARFLIPRFVDADFYHFRDSDSIITDRELLYLTLITPTDPEVLIFRDHRLHFSPILAGMISMRRDTALGISLDESIFLEKATYNYDQTALVSKIYGVLSERVHVATSAISYRSESPILLTPSPNDFIGMPDYWTVNEFDGAGRFLRFAILKSSVPLLYLNSLSKFYQRGWFITLVSWISFLLTYVDRLKRVVGKLVIG